MIPYPPHRLSFDGVSKARGPRPLFSHLTFSLAPHELLWIHGDNGSGKTSILRLAAGLSQPSQGEISWQIEGRAADPRALIAYQGHKDAHKAGLSAGEELQFWLDIYDRGEDAATLAARAGLSGRLGVDTSALSAGQRRRLSLARLMASGKPVWIMDEPAAAMDRDGQSLIDLIMTDHLAKGGAILAASHNPARQLGTQSGAQARRIHLKTLHHQEVLS